MKSLRIPISLFVCFLLVGLGAYLFQSIPIEVTSLQEDRVSSSAKVQPIVSKGEPVILVHGFNQSNQFWKDIDIVSEMEGRGFVHMGDFVSHAKDHQGCELSNTKAIKQGQSALYTLSMPELGTLDIEESAKLLENGVKHALTRHQCETVKLVGFSMGGVVIREYLTTTDDHGVSQLVTISSPHSGTAHAWIANLYQWVVERQSSLEINRPSGWKNKLLSEGQKLSMQQVKKVLDNLAQSTQVPVNSKAAQMLTPPQQNNYLEKLNSRKHPEDVDYHSVITEENMLTIQWSELQGEWQKLMDKDFRNSDFTAASVDLLRVCLSKFDELEQASKLERFRGDGVVSCFSQDMNNISAFKNSSKLKSEVSNVETSHLVVNIKKELLDLLLGD